MSASKLAENLLALRREREAIFGRNLFSDPAWDILLRLFVAGERGEKLSVTELILAVGVSSTTALRWISELERQGIIARARFPDHGRKVALSLSEAAKEAVRSLLEQHRL